MATAFPDDDEGPRGAADIIKQTPCLRKSLLVGLNALFFVGFAQFFHSGIVRRAAKWGYGGFVVGFGVYASMCSLGLFFQDRQMERLVREQARRKEDAVRDLFGRDAVESYGAMLQQAREAEEKRLLFTSQENNQIA